MPTSRTPLPESSFSDFGTLLRALRLRARLTQRELGIAVGYSEAQISRLEQGKRLPDPSVVAALFLPSLSLAREPELAARLHDLAKAARRRDDLAAGPELAPPDLGAPGGSDPGDLMGIPVPPRPNVERPVLAAQLRDRLTRQRCVLVCGPPGIGKTTLAATVARDRAEQVPVCWLTLTRGITTPAEAVIRHLARFLAAHGQPDVAGLAAPGQREQPLPRDEQLHLITVALNHTRALVCLDNSHLLSTEPDTLAVVEHLAAASRSQFLAVGREEQQLPGFDVIRLDGLGHAEARVLIRQLLGPGSSVPLPVLLPAALADRLIERTDGSPMLIRLALGQVRAGDPDPAALVERLEAQPAIAGYLLETTLAGLSEAGRRLLAQLAVFRHPVDLLDERLTEASEAFGGPFDRLAGLDELRRRQLVGHATRASLHPLVHDHAYAWLAGSAADRKRLHRVAAAYCAHALADPLEASWHHARAGDVAEAATSLITHGADLGANGQPERAADLAAELLATGALAPGMARGLLAVRGDLLTHTERSAEAESAYREALAQAVLPTERAEVAWRLAQSLRQRGQVREAVTLCRETAATLDEGEYLLRAQLAAVQSGAYLMLSEYQQAQDVAAQACALAGQAGGDKAGEDGADAAVAVRVRAYSVLGITARLQGQPDVAAGWLRQAVAAARAARLHGEMAGRALFNLGAIAHENGEIGRAEQLYEEALAAMRSISDGYGTARVLHSLGMIRHIGGSPGEALTLLAESCALKRRIGDPQGAANSEHASALVLLTLGRLAEARALMSSVLAATGELGERRSRAYYLDSMAMISLAQSETAVADRYTDEAAVLATAIGDRSLLAEIAVHRALSELAAGDLSAAQRLTDTAGEAVASVGPVASPRLALQHLALTACLALASGQPATAATLAGRMLSRAEENGLGLQAQAARRIAAAAQAALAGSRPEPAAYPRLMWVAGEA